jgi:macrolide-specific efflux system membrane fusion protein
VKKKIIAPVMALLLVGIGFSSYRFIKTEKAEVVAYDRVPASAADLMVTILSTGIVKPENKLDIKPPIAGRVETVLVKEGVRVKKGQTLAWMSSTERAAMLDAATARGPEELAKWQELYRPTPILAPIDGTVIQRNVESGQTFTTTDAVFVMSDRLTIKAQVDETDISKIKLGQHAVVTLDAYSGETVQARVDQIAFDATTVNNVTTYVVDVLPLKTPAYMRSGMTANVTFEVDSHQGVLSVPANAVKVEGGKTVVLLMDEATQKPTPREVQTGASDGKRTEITAGLGAGEKVLVVAFHGLGARKSAASNPFGMGPPKTKKGGAPGPGGP